MGLSSANDRQHGGDHYKKREYQHWDFVCDIGLHYLLGCATKYVARWKDKNGREDLEKAVHYIEKAQERRVAPPVMDEENYLSMRRFVSQLDDDEASVVKYVVMGAYDMAIGAIDYLLPDLDAGLDESPQSGGDGE